MSLFLFAAILLGLTFRIIYLHRSTQRMSLLRSHSYGPLSWEVRRQVGLHLVPSASEFPLPREVRTRVIRFAGVVLWRETESIGLPLNRSECPESVTAQEFDRHFPVHLRVSEGL